MLACSTSGGLSAEQGLGCFRFHASLVVLRVLPGVGAGSEVRGEGLRCSQAAVVLAYEVQVTVSVLLCLATLFCCDLLGLSEQTLGCFRFHVNLVAPRVLPGVGAGSEARGEGRLFLRMRLRLLYSFCVVICWGRARRAPRSGPSRP